MKYVYILLTRSQTLVSKAIGESTGDKYTHASIAYDGELKTLCSFARRYVRFPLPAGLVRENIKKGYFDNHRYMPCMLLALPVTQGVHEKVRRKIDGMLAVKEQYRYSAAGLFYCRMGVESEKEYHYFCSQFVAEVLTSTGAAELPKAPSLMRPQDFCDLPELRCVYEGEICGLTNLAMLPLCSVPVSIS